MSILLAAAGLLSGYVSGAPEPLSVVGGANTLTVTSQPATPAAPTVTGDNLTLTVTG
jgi:hypothetical protein